MVMGVVSRVGMVCIWGLSLVWFACGRGYVACVFTGEVVGAVESMSGAQGGRI